MRPVRSFVPAILLCGLIAGCPAPNSPVSGSDAGSSDAGGPFDSGSLDAGTPDSGNSPLPDDAGATDAGSTDAGEHDAGLFDGGAQDAGANAGVADAGLDDAGLASDAGANDAGLADAGANDAGLAGATDAGLTSDAGESDAGSMAAACGSSAACDPNATCVGIGAAATCSCNASYVGDGLRCEPFTPTTLSMWVNHVCAIRADGSLWCWGKNEHGQLGDGTQQDRSTPVEILPGTTWSAVASGWSQTCGIQSDGSLWCWGDQSLTWNPAHGATLAATPERVGTSTQWRQISIGFYNVCGIQSDGSLWCWGDNSDNESLGGSSTSFNHSGATVAQPTLIPTAPGAVWTGVSCGNNFNCGLQSDGSLWCWGFNEWGMLGIGSITAPASPTRLNSSSYVDVSSSWERSCAVRSDGTLWCWGLHLLNAFAPNTGTPQVDEAPTQFGQDSDWASVSVSSVIGDGDLCAIKRNGTLWCVGKNSSGQLGVGDLVNRPDFVQVGTGTNWKTVVAGNDSTCAETNDGHISCWGGDEHGQVGDGVPTMLTPSQVAPGTTWQAISLGGSVDSDGQTHADGVGVQMGGTLWQWGQYGAFATPSIVSEIPVQVGTASNWTSVSAGPRGQCAEDAQGNLSCFGSNMKSVDPVEMGSFVSSAQDQNATCALDTAGQEWCWGGNDRGEFGTGMLSGGSMTPVSAGHSMTWSFLTAGAQQVCGISGGLGYCSGEASATMECDKPVGVPGGGQWSMLAAGGSYGCGVHPDGTLQCWGYGNYQGELGPTAGSPTPPIPGTWSSVAAANATTCGIQTDGSLWCWGTLNPIVATPDSFIGNPDPVQLGAGSQWLRVSICPVGLATICAVRADNTLWCWGDNGSGARGDGDAWRLTPFETAF